MGTAYDRKERLAIPMYMATIYMVTMQDDNKRA